MNRIFYPFEASAILILQTDNSSHKSQLNSCWGKPTYLQLETREQIDIEIPAKELKYHFSDLMPSSVLWDSQL